MPTSSPTAPAPWSPRSVLAGLSDARTLTADLSSRLRLVSALGGAVLVVAAVAAHWSHPVTALALGALIAVAAWLAAIDLAVHRLPNAIVGPLALVVTVWLVVAGLATGDLRRTLIALAVGLGAAALFLVGNIVAGIGMGDVKYAFPVFAVAAWFGGAAVQTTLLVMAFSAGLVAAGILVGGGGRRTDMAYGPYMSLGLAVALILAA